MTEKSKRKKRERKRSIREAEFRMTHYWHVCGSCGGSGWINDLEYGDDDPCTLCDAEGGWWNEKGTHRMVKVTFDWRVTF